MNYLQRIRIGLFLLLWIGGISLLLGQSTDPTTKKLLEQVKKTYHKIPEYKIRYTILIQSAEKKETRKSGVLIDAKKKYYLEMPEQNWYCDGKSLWIHLKSKNEVQWKTVPEPGDASDYKTPRDYFTMYERADFYCGNQFEGNFNKKPVTFLECAPKNKSEELFKYRLAINRKTSLIEGVELFYRDATRITLIVDKMETTKTWDGTIFIFPREKFPKVHLEDLRE